MLKLKYRFNTAGVLRARCGVFLASQIVNGQSTEMCNALAQEQVLSYKVGVSVEPYGLEEVSVRGDVQLHGVESQ